jgi:hypothetical protein
MPLLDLALRVGGNAADLFSKQPNPPKWAKTLITRYSLDRLQDPIVRTDGPPRVAKQFDRTIGHIFLGDLSANGFLGRIPGPD